MIPIQRKPEPADFDSLVRQPGLSFLRINPNPTKTEWKRHRYWKKIASEMYNIYNGICAYSGEWIPKPGSIDHFVPKKSHPELAYEWNNYRLCAPKLNSYKDEHEGIADPFTIQYGWFILKIPSCLIMPGDDLSADVKQLVEYTIDILKLNDDDDLVQNRCNILVYYSKGDISFNFLRDRYPFIAYELQRQNMVETIKHIFRTPSR